MGQVYRRESDSAERRRDRWLRRSRGRATSGSCDSPIERTVLVTERSVLEAADFRLTADMEPGEASRDTLPPVGSMTMDEIEKAMILKSMKHHTRELSVRWPKHSA